MCINARDDTKAGLILGLFGGTTTNSEIATRCDPHVLVVGDPGLGKSQVRPDRYFFLCTFFTISTLRCCPVCARYFPIEATLQRPAISIINILLLFMFDYVSLLYVSFVFVCCPFFLFYSSWVSSASVRLSCDQWTSDNQPNQSTFMQYGMVRSSSTRRREY